MADFSTFNPQFETFYLPGESASNSVQCIVQDAVGFLWFATQDGLYRYDGHQFLAYRYDPFNENSIADNYVEWIFIDSRGLLWLPHFTGKGLTVFDPVSETFIRYLHDPDNPSSLSNNNVQVVTEDIQGYIWIGTFHGLNRFDPQTGNFQRFNHAPDDPHSLSYNLVRALYVDRAGTLWVGCGFPWDEQRGKPGGLNRYDPHTGTFTRYLHDPDDPGSLADNRVRVIFEDSKGTFWIGTAGDGLHQMDRETGTFTRLAYDPAQPDRLSHPYLRQQQPSLQNFSQITILNEDQNGRIWIGAFNGGLNVFDPTTHQMRHFEAGTGPGDLATNFVWHFCETRDGTVWIAGGSNGGMVMKVRPADSPFSFFQHPAFASQSWAMAILEAQDRSIWLATPGQDALLYRYDRQTDVVRPYLELSANEAWNQTQILTMCEDRKGMIWAGTSIGLLWIHPATGAFKIYENRPGNPHRLPDVDIENIFLDSKDQLWLGTFGGGLLRLNPARNHFDHFLPATDQPGAISGDKIRWVMEDRRGNIWVGGGCNCNDPEMPIFLDRFDASTAQFEHFETTGDVGVAFSMDEDAEGNIWYSDHTHGIRMLNPRTGRIKKYSLTNSSIAVQAIRSLRTGSDGKVWLATANSITVFDPERELFFPFKEAQGMKVKNLGWGACFKNDTGELFFAGRGSFLSFRPDQISRLQASLPSTNMAVTGFNLHNVPQTYGNSIILDLPIWETREIRLLHHQNVFSLNVACFDFSGGNLEYKLENYDQLWRHDLRNGEASYFNVLPGNYTFRTRSANRFGGWNPGQISLRITILPPWWKTWWAYLTYFLFLAGVLFAFYKFQLNRQLEQAEAVRLRELDTFKNRLYINITHEFRTPLTVISGMADQIQENPREWFREGLTMIKRNSSRLLELVNQMLDLAKLENGSIMLHLQQGDVVNYLKYLIESFHSFGESRGVQFHFLSDPEALTMDFDPERLQQVVTNLLSNAVKFTPAGGHVYLSLSRHPVENDPTNLILRIRDTGVGIPEEKLPFIFERFYQVDDSSSRFAEGSGIGLALVKELILLMGGDIQVKSTTGQGTEFRIRLPIRQEAPEINTLNIFNPADIAHTIPLKMGKTPLFSFSESSGLTDPYAAPLLLLAEDNADVVAYLASCLTGAYRLAVARDGRECVDIAFEIVPDLIITDIMMPYQDGLEVCRILKNDERTSHVPIIMLTARADAESRLTGLEQGADAYLAKPFHQKELLIEIRKLLDLRQKLQQHYRMVAGLEKGTSSPGNIPAVPEPEDYFVKKVRRVVEKHLDNLEFTVEELCRELHISNAHLHRKLTALTGFSATKFIRYIRLNRAKELLRNPVLTITAVAFDTGFNDPSYFGRVFKQEFGLTPAEWRERESSGSA